MAIIFVVEDGSGKADATSYLDIDAFRQYWENKGVDYSSPTKTDDEVKVALNAATEYIDLNYNFEGEPVNVDTQALEWPRQGVTDRYGNWIESDEIPVDLQNATAYLAAQSFSADLMANVTENIRSKKIGTAAYSFSGATTKRFRVADNYLKWYISQATSLTRVN